jgi:hypothetical protein
VAFAHQAAMTFDEIHPSVRNSYAAHQRLLRIGFDADHLFTGAFPYAAGGVNVVRVAIRRDGKNLFVIDVCGTELNNEQYSAKWNDLVKAIQVDGVVSDETRELMYDEWPVDNAALLRALQERGLLPEMSPS